MEDRHMTGLDPKGKPKEDGKQKVESKPIVENKATTDTRKKSRKFLILVVSIVLVVAGSVTYLAFPYLKGVKTASSQKEVKRHQVKEILALEPFLVNLADTDTSRFVKTTFQLGLAEELEEKEKNTVAIAAMRDSIISLLSSKTAEQLLTTQGKDKLREEVRSRMNSVSPKIKVLEVYIVDFVIQL
jgi:flagellar FliL protein